MQMEPGDKTYRNMVVRLTDLTVTDDAITGVTFENCTIVGPAVVVLMDCTLSRSGFEGDWDAFVWPIADEREWIVGAIGLVQCEFYNCRFQRIGLGVHEKDLAAFRAGFND